MAKVYEGVDATMAVWIEKQPVFFVATAPLEADGLVNLSPKGTMGTFRMVDKHTFAYLTDAGTTRLAYRGVYLVHEHPQDGWEADVVAKMKRKERKY